MSRRTLALLIIGGVVLGLVFISLLSLGKSGNVEFVVVPGDATLVVDGKKNRGKSGNYEPGEHTVKVSRRGFSNQTKIFVAKETKQIIEIALTPNSQEGFDWLKDHPKESYLRESIIGEVSKQSSEAKFEKNPIMNILPFIDREWRVDYGRSVKYPEDLSKISVVITYTSEQGKQDALDWLRFKGFNPDELEIIYN